MMVAMEKLKIIEARKKERGIRTMTKEEFLKWKEDEDKDEEETVVELDPLDLAKAEHYNKRGNGFFTAGDSLGGYQMYLESLKYNPGNIAVIMNLCAAAAKLNKWEEGINSGNYAIIKTDGKSSKAWFR